MIRKIKSFVLSGLLLLAVGAPGVLPLIPSAVAVAACPGIADQVATGATDASGSSVSCDNTATSDNSTSVVSSLAKKVVAVFSIIVGAASVFMVIYGGFRYITSGGDSTRVGNAKNTLIYAIVGLIIVAVAQALVHFVLSNANNAAGNGT